MSTISIVALTCVNLIGPWCCFGSGVPRFAQVDHEVFTVLQTYFFYPARPFFSANLHFFKNTKNFQPQIAKSHPFQQQMSAKQPLHFFPPFGLSTRTKTGKTIGVTSINKPTNWVQKSTLHPSQSLTWNLKILETIIFWVPFFQLGSV